MSYYSDFELKTLGFRSIGRNVKISTKSSIYDPERIEIGDNSRIDDFCLLSGSIKLGRNVYIGPFCNIAGGLKGVDMDDFVVLAYGVNVFAQTDDYTGRTIGNPTVPKKYKNEKICKNYIGKHVMVGAGSYVMPGVRLEEGTSVGAMSLVTKSTIPWKIYVGIPARAVEDRHKDLLELEKQYLEEWSG